MSVTQHGRFISINTPLGPDVLLLQSFVGSEGISRLFRFNLELLSEDPAIAMDSLIGKPVAITLALADDSQRFFHGVVNRFGQSGEGTRFSSYYAEVVPSLWLLTQKSDCRIFQSMAVPEVVKKIFDDHKISYRDALTGKYTKWDYCVQYRETHFNFVSRLMEEEGIFYFFEYEENKHTLVLADSPGSHRPCSNQSQVRFLPEAGMGEWEDTVTAWQMEQSLHPGKYTLRDYHFEMPNKSLEVLEPASVKVGGNDTLEVYDYPGHYAQRFQLPEQRLGQLEPEGRKLVKLRMEEEESPHFVISGSSTCRTFTAGYRFERILANDRRDENGPYVLISVQHSAIQSPAYVSGSVTAGPYQNGFTCIPHRIPYRPPRVTPKPMVQGPQTAIVTGPAGEEIFTDKYGRVKVQFHWDREGEYNEKSSCWIRVAQIWAGKQWGSMFIPRIGQEVIVDFLEGDPDQPIITGRVYNAEEMPPYELPKEQTKSTVKTLSSKGGGGFNEIRFEDKKGEEQVFIHGEKDLDVRIKNDRREWIGRDRHLFVKRDKVEEVDRDEHVVVKRDLVEEITRDHHLSVTGKEAIQITGSHSLSVQGDVIEEFKMNHSEQVTMNYYLKGMNVVIEGMTGLTIKVGGSFITINPAGVQIVGPMIMINSGGAPLVGTPGTLVSPAAAAAALIADNADPGSKDASYKSQFAAMSPAAIAAASAPWHDPHSEEAKQKKSWIEIELVDEDKKPVPGERYRITLPDGTTLAEGTLDEKGRARVEGIDPGTCKVTFPDLDKDAWEPA